MSIWCTLHVVTLQHTVSRMCADHALDPAVSEPDSKEYVFELRASGPFTLTVTFEHPCTPGMASSKDKYSFKGFSLQFSCLTSLWETWRPSGK